MKLVNMEITDDTIREYRIEFETVEERHKALEIVREEYQRGNHRIYSAREGFRWEYAGEVISDDSKALFIVCPSSTYRFLLGEWHESI